MTIQDTSASHFAALVERVLNERWQTYPYEAASSGLHEYDGRLPPVTQASIDARAAQLRAAIAEAEAIVEDGLSRQERFDRDLMLLGLRDELFGLMEWQPFRKNPMTLLEPFEFTHYLDRAYAPVEQRLDAVLQTLRGVPAYLDAARALLRPPFAAPVLRQSIESAEGIASFYGADLDTFINEHAGPEQAKDLHDARNSAISALHAYVDYLKSQEATATQDFAIGADVYTKMLSFGEAVDIPLAEIEAAGERELRRHQETVRAAAERIAPGRPVNEAIAVVTRDHPTAERLIDETRAMLEEIRAFTVERNVASVVSEVRAQVRETPAFMRWAFAAMDGPGPFEEVATESFYYVTPVEPQWTAEQAEEWLSNFNYATLKIISVHEVYPGHYVHFLRHHQAPSPAAKVFGAYSFWEGWAHYCEEMFLEAGYGEDDPKLRYAMAQEALVRVCRLLCSLRMHTQGMTLEEAARFFQTQAFMEELPAQKEALRGTFDPGYLNYTLGKMLIAKLRDDWQREQGTAYSMKTFHDELLSHGAPQIPLLRKHLLRNDDGRLL